MAQELPDSCGQGNDGETLVGKMTIADTTVGFRHCQKVSAYNVDKDLLPQLAALSLRNRTDAKRVRRPLSKKGESLSCKKDLSSTDPPTMSTYNLVPFACSAPFQPMYVYFFL